MRELSGKIALVTGAGSGIGRATALAFADEGCKLVVCDISDERLAEIRGVLEQRGALVHAARVDVADRAAMQAFAQAVHAKVPAVDVLVNNAGVGLYASVLEATLEDWDWIVGVNLWGVIHGMHFFLPAMVKRGLGGHVANVASGLGLAAGPETGPYSTTKFGVVGLSEAARYDLAPHGIGVSAICPGVINTPIAAQTRYRTADPEGVRARTTKLFARRNYPPEKVARAIVAAVRNDRGVAPVTPEARFFWLLKRYTPWLLPPLVRLMPR